MGKSLPSPGVLRTLEQDDAISLLTTPPGRKSSEATSSHQAEIVQELIALRDQGEEAPPGKFVVPSHTIPARIPEGQESIMAYEVDDFTRYRSTTDLHDLEDRHQEGLAKLNMVGCPQFSKSAFARIKELSCSRKPFVLDLREEFHAFVEGISVSWYASGNHNWGKNPGRSPEEIHAKLFKKIDKLKCKSGPLVIPSRADLKKQTESHRQTKMGGIEPLTIEDFTNAEIQTESEMVKGFGGEYKHFPIADHTRPSDTMIDRIVATFREISALNRDVTIVVHCHGGMGRTTFVMTMYDMLHNARHVARDVIVARQIKLRRRDEARPDQLPEAKAYQKLYAAEKVELRNVFYQYAQQNPIGKLDAVSWTQFLAANK